MTPAQPWAWRAVLAAALLVAAAGCQPKIGDECQVSTDCSSSGDRLCDTTQPGGYCTIFNCEPGTCPDEAVCVAFNGEVSASKECADPQGTPRLQRTFCMRKCDSKGDCRRGYSCFDMKKPNPWGAVVVERGSSHGKVCTVPYSGADLPAGGAADVCTGHTPSIPIDAAPPPDAPAPDAGQDAPVPDAGPDVRIDAGPDVAVEAGGIDAGGG